MKSLKGKYILAPALAGLLALPIFAQASAQQQRSVSAADLYKAASPSVVLIEIYGDDGKVSGSGSGFIVSADGAILTNYHVIAHTKRATVRLANGDAYDDVSVLDLDKRKDIALIKIKAVGLLPLKLGQSSTAEIGDTLYALGNPLGMFQNTLSEGILSGVRQADGYKLFQLSTPISHGSSGSPVFDARGQVVGIIEATIEEGQNLNFAIPIDYAGGMLDSRVPRSLESIYEPPETEGTDGSAQPAMALAQPSDALKSDPLDYIAEKLGVWAKDDADKEFGQPYARRDSFLKSVSVGDIYKYKSPDGDGTFGSVELNFQRSDGKLAGAYFYPANSIGWSAVQAKLGRHYSKQKASNGSVFYMYQISQHQLAVYVDSLGYVVSLGVW